MALILCIETATEACSAALFRNGTLLALRESKGKNVHSSLLTVFMQELMQEAGVPFEHLDAVAVSKGPGSYTGLRIGVAAAKGLCYALGKPFIAVSTLQAMAAGMKDEEKPAFDPSPHIPHPTPFTLYCPMIDARRMEVYCALYDTNLQEVRDVRAEIIDADSFSEFLAAGKVVFAGEGAAKCLETLGGHPNAVFREGFHASARYLGRFAEDRFNSALFEDLAYFEPFYLKDFVAGKPRVKGLDS